MSKPRKGASQLHLDIHELRWELVQADEIIKEACQLLGQEGQDELAFRLVENDVTTYADPIGQKSRRNAMHRIKPKRDIVITLLMVAIAILFLSSYSARTDNELLRAELAQAQSKQAQSQQVLVQGE